MHFRRLAATSAMLLSLACNKQEQVNDRQSPPSHSDEPAKAANQQASMTTLAAKQVPAEPPAPVAAELKLTADGNSMTFDVTSFTVKAGAPVHVVLNNNKPGALAHNWVLVRPGTEASVAAAGLKAGHAKDYLPDSPDVLAHTAMITPGNHTETTFNAPMVPGSYPYICSFPGHYMMMKGVLNVVGS